MDYTYQSSVDCPADSSLDALMELQRAGRLERRYNSGSAIDPIVHFEHGVLNGGGYRVSFNGLCAVVNAQDHQTAKGVGDIILRVVERRHGKMDSILS